MSIHLRFRQRGQILLALLALLGLAFASAFYFYYKPGTQALEANKVTDAALVQARDALIGRAASATDRPGSLPCPDTDNDGAENWAGGVCASYVGRLPWKTLGLTDLRDGSGERLWYALSSNFRDDSGVQPLNSDSAGQLTIAGTSPASSVIAIIFAPGPVLGSQQRSTADQNAVANYLEGENNNGDLTFVTGSASTTLNDRLLQVTSDALFAVVAVRVAKDVRQALQQYRTANGYYPFANDYPDVTPYPCKDTQRDGRIPLVIQAGCPALAEWTGQLPAWFSANNWNLVTHYGMDNACGLTVTGVTTSGCTVVIVSGRALGGQSRPCTNAASCLEDAENANGDSAYVKPSRAPTSNDRLAVMCQPASGCETVP